MRQKAHSKHQAIDISEKNGIRYLHFGSAWVQGAMRIARPSALELAYTREMMAGLLMRPAEWPHKALLIGLGAGSLAKFIHRHLPHCRMTVVEIDPRMEAVARQYFNLPDDPKRLRLVVGDGAEYLLGSSETYNLILCDGFDADARTGALSTLPFYQACRARLADDGLFSVNLLGRNRDFAASAEHIAEAFDGRSMVFPPCASGNAIAFATGGQAVDVGVDELRQRADRLKADTGLDLLPTLDRLVASDALAHGRLRL